MQVFGIRACGMECLFTCVGYRYSAHVQHVVCPGMSNSCSPTDCSPSGSAARRISQVRILEWGAISYSGGYSRLGMEPESPALAGNFFTTSTIWEDPPEVNPGTLKSSLEAQTVKGKPAMQETQVPSLGLEDPLDSAQYSCLRIPWWARGVTKSWIQLSD